MRSPTVYKPKGAKSFRVEWVPLIEQRAGTFRKKRKSAKARSEQLSQALAESWARQIELAHSKGEEWATPEAREAEVAMPSVAEVVLAWLTMHQAKDERARAQGRQPNTLRTYRSQIRVLRDFLEDYEGVGLDAIPASRLGDEELLNDYYDWALRPSTSNVMDRPRRPTTAYKLVEVAIRPLRWAAGRSQFRGRVFAPTMPDDLERPPPSRKKVPSFEVAASAVLASKGWITRPMTLLYYLGLRINSQIMWLEWRDFDLSEEKVHVRGVLGKSKQERRGREVPISPRLATELREWAREDGIDLRRPPTAGEERFVVSLAEARRNPKGELRARSLRGRDVKRAWKRADAWRAEFGQPSHIFRAVLYEGLLRLRVDRDAASHLIGHEVGTATGRIYASPDVELEEPMREAVALIPALPRPPAHAAEDD